MGEARGEALRVGFDRSIKLEFHGAKAMNMLQWSYNTAYLLTAGIACWRTEGDHFQRGMPTGTPHVPAWRHMQ